jgi:8-oxo-dGTP pyrophosphatase MutT (NUDIX family)
MERTVIDAHTTSPKRLTAANSTLAKSHLGRIKERGAQGIACCRYNSLSRSYEILLICKRFTYSFNAFLHGKYNSGNDAELIQLFSSMTLEEKLDILSLNFAQMWYRVWLHNMQRTTSYFFAKNKYENAFVADGGGRLRKLISKSTHADKIWEIPKGRKKNKAESNIQCAVREFHEETGIPKKGYKLFPWAKSTHTYLDSGVRYSNTYYLAFTRCRIEPTINFNLQEQVGEVSDVRWMNINEIRQVDKLGRLEKVIRPIFNFIKKYTRV